MTRKREEPPNPIAAVRHEDRRVNIPTEEPTVHTRSSNGHSGPSGKIAVKVINHYGDEVPKIYASRDWP